MPSKRIAVRTGGAAWRRLWQPVGAVCVLTLWGAAFAEELAEPLAGPNLAGPTTISKIVNADHEIAIRGYALFDRKTCAGLEPPAVDLDVPPGHGVVCLRRNNHMPLRLLQEGAPLRCLGKITSGLRVIYLPHHGYTGADTMRYTVHYHPRKITYTANLIVVPDVPPSPGAVWADISGAAGDAPQSPGPIPPCPAPVS
jgi:hypothetical protein